MAEINDLSTTDASNTARFPENQSPSSVNDGARALEGMLARGLKDTVDGCVTTGGSSTAYTVAANRTLTAYYDGLTQCVKWHTASGSTPTVNIDSLGAKSLYWPNGTQVTTNDLAANSRSWIQYDGTNFLVMGAPVPVPIALGGTGATTASTAFSNLKQAASDTATGVVELATTAETTTGTDTARAVTPAGLHAGFKALTDTTIATGDQIYFADASDSNNMKSDTVQGILDLVPANGFTTGTEQATTSGSSVTFGSIPAGTKQINIAFKGVSMTTNSQTIYVEIGDAGGLETSGYVGMSVQLDTTPSLTETALSASFVVVPNSNAGENYSGVMTLILEDASDFTWCAKSHVAHNTAAGTPSTLLCAGYKSLSAELTQLAVKTSGTFDAGAVNIQYIG